MCDCPSGTKSPNVSPSASSVKLTMSPSGHLSSPPTTIPTLFPTTPPTSYPSPAALADASPSNCLHSSQIEGSTGGKVASTASRSPGASTAVLILSVIVAVAAVLVLYLRSTRRKKRIDRCIDNSYQDQQHLTLQASTREIQGYTERINATTSDTNGHANFEDDSHAPSSPTDRSASSRTWDRDVNHHFAQHFSPRSLVDPSSSRSMSTMDEESLASSPTNLGLHLPPEAAKNTPDEVLSRRKANWLNQQNSTFQVSMSPFDHPSVAMERSPPSKPQRQRQRGLVNFCNAPMGPLGLIIDSSANGPLVHSLKPNSPMVGLLKPGDCILAIDDVDTRHMNAAALTQLMAKRALNPTRKIMFKNGPLSSSEDSI
mmetsp:Transcript_18955/g.26943  ORF Transcript_18955/g.26943 Transcript_18955/m.26943 type:complete len:372 (+) Transcript_18955:10-1125(+)